MRRERRAFFASSTFRGLFFHRAGILAREVFLQIYQGGAAVVFRRHVKGSLVSHPLAGQAGQCLCLPARGPRRAEAGRDQQTADRRAPIPVPTRLHGVVPHSASQ